MQKTIDIVFEDDITFHPVQLKANDVDACHDEFTAYEDKNLVIDMSSIERKAIEGIKFGGENTSLPKFKYKDFPQEQCHQCDGILFTR